MHHSLRLWYFTLASLIKWKSFAVKCWFKLLISSTPSSSSTPARSLSLQSLGTRLSLPSSLPLEPGYKAISPQQSPLWAWVQGYVSPAVSPLNPITRLALSRSLLQTSDRYFSLHDNVTSTCIFIGRFISIKGHAQICQIYDRSCQRTCSFFGVQPIYNKLQYTQEKYQMNNNGMCLLPWILLGLQLKKTAGSCLRNNIIWTGVRRASSLRSYQVSGFSEKGSMLYYIGRQSACMCCYLTTVKHLRISVENGRIVTALSNYCCHVRLLRRCHNFRDYN